jgi:hypothetical protein
MLLGGRAHDDCRVEPSRLAAEIREIAELRDPVGILSIYVDASPREGEGRDAAAVAVRSALRRLEHDARAEGPHARLAALEALLDRLEPELNELTSPQPPGRGRALFAQVEGDAVRTVAVQVPFPTRVGLAHVASIRPLVAALAATRPAGLAAVTRDSVRLIQWHPGGADEIASYATEVSPEEWGSTTRPADSRPAVRKGRESQQSAAQDDRFEQRLDEARKRLQRALIDDISVLAAKRGWDVLVVAGEEEATETITEGLAGASFETVRHPALMAEYLSPAGVADALGSTVEGARERRGRAAAERAVAAALSGGAGAVGLADTLEALAEGRVHELILDPAREHEGAETPEGLLFPAGIVPAGSSPTELRAEPMLVDRMIERAVATDAAVTVLGEGSASVLAEHDGVAAILRW